MICAFVIHGVSHNKLDHFRWMSVLESHLLTLGICGSFAPFLAILFASSVPRMHVWALTLRMVMLGGC